MCFDPTPIPTCPNCGGIHTSNNPHLNEEGLPPSVTHILVHEILLAYEFPPSLEDTHPDYVKALLQRGAHILTAIGEAAVELEPISQEAATNPHLLASAAGNRPLLMRTDVFKEYRRAMNQLPEIQPTPPGFSITVTPPREAPAGDFPTA